jgi:hypothetical protein
MSTESENQISPTVLQVSSNNEDYPDYPVIFVITLTKNVVQDLLSYRPIFEAALAAPASGQLYEMKYWWTGLGEFVTGIQLDGPDPLFFSDTDDIVEDTSLPEDERLRTECDYLIVTDKGVRWEAYIKHTNVTIETQDTLTWAELEEKAR